MTSRYSCSSNANLSLWRGERRSEDRDPPSQRTGEMHRGPLWVHLSSGPTETSATDGSRGSRAGPGLRGRGAGVRRRRQALIQSCEASIRFGDLHGTPSRRRRLALPRTDITSQTVGGPAGIDWTECAVATGRS